MNQFTWGLWLSTTTPYGGKAQATLEEAQLRELLKALLPLMGWDINRALDSVKDLMTKQLNAIVEDRRKAKAEVGSG